MHSRQPVVAGDWIPRHEERSEQQALGGSVPWTYLQIGTICGRVVAADHASGNRMIRQTTLTVRAPRPGLHEFTADVTRFVQECQCAQGLLTLFVRHTSCSLLVQENADPDVRADLDEFFRRLVPSGDDPSMQWVRHGMEGPDDMPGHIKAALTATSLSIPVMDGRLALGRWQGIFLFEHRDRGQSREVVLHLSA